MVGEAGCIGCLLERERIDDVLVFDFPLVEFVQQSAGFMVSHFSLFIVGLFSFFAAFDYFLNSMRFS